MTDHVLGKCHAWMVNNLLYCFLINSQLNSANPGTFQSKGPMSLVNASVVPQLQVQSTSCRAN